MPRGFGAPCAQSRRKALRSTGPALADPICVLHLMSHAAMPWGAFAARLATLRAVSPHAADRDHS